MYLLILDDPYMDQEMKGEVALVQIVLRHLVRCRVRVDLLLLPLLVVDRPFELNNTTNLYLSYAAQTSVYVLIAPLL